ncbi:PH domain-containing protein [Deinococcus puniceus]|uniref:Bacterial Pleckstrin homology domain-containing protein n=1 Tax=Deinococcus puniceus TaxID=1182568 RepID=A0A172TBZ7_9DEIO|nr:PH domain-containing protein [Deinococcus puniceus]ANE44323.1 hypothetical protein SU48_11730 [Deinococcus puniceus]
MAPANAQLLATATEPTPRSWPLVRWSFVAIFASILTFTALPSLQARPVYEVRGGQIIARSVTSSRVIPAGTPVTSEQLTRLRKVMGSNTTGYVVGRFSVPRYRMADLYTDGSNPMLVFLTRPRVTVLTPADPEALLATWRTGGTGVFRPARSPSVSTELILATLILTPLLAFLMRPPRMTYRLTPDALEVRTGLHKHRFPFAATRAELTWDGLGMRLFGTAIPGYYTGSFSTKAGGVSRIQALATAYQPSQAVVLKLDGVAYYLTPADPAALAAYFENSATA